MRMKCRFGKHIPKTVFEPTDSDEFVEYRRECMVCEKVLYGPHIVNANMIDLINEIFMLVSG